MMRSFFIRHQVLAFWLLALLLALLSIGPAILIFQAFPDFGPDMYEANQGRDYNTNILYSLPIALRVSGGAWFAALLLGMPFSASLSAILSSLIINGKKQVKILFKRFRFWAPDISKSAGIKIWLQAIGTVVGLNLVYSLLINYANGVELKDFFVVHSLYSVKEIIFIFFTGLFFEGGGLMEELGWRGFALPRLQESHGPLKASIILGIIWSLWHIPIKLNVWPIHECIAFYFFFTITCILYCIIITYFYNRLGGSILIGVAIHGLFNDPTGLSGFFNSPLLEDPQGLYSHGVLVMLLLVVVFTILYREGPNLALRKGDKQVAASNQSA